MNRRDFTISLVFAVCYLALDWISSIHALEPVNITPWNPPAGLALALLLVGGVRFAPIVFVCVVAGDLLVRDLLHAPLFILGNALLVTGIYAGAATALHRWLRFDVTLSRLRDVFMLMGCSVVAAALVALSYVALAWALGLVPGRQVVLAAGRYWIGDTIGIAVLVPLILIHRSRRWTFPAGRLALEILAQAGAVLLALWLIFGLVKPGYEFRLFYLLFLPMIWIGARFCIEGATLGNLAAQIGVIAGFELMDYPTPMVTTFQYGMLALTAASLFLGAAVSERRRVEAALRSRQDELAQFSRLSMAGEMAAALAHELNQPLMATIAFTRAAQRMLVGGAANLEKAGGALDRAVSEAQRAGDIVRNLREFMGSGMVHRRPEAPAALVADALALVAPSLTRQEIRVGVSVDKALPVVHVDKVQVQQVILNLVRNAMEALGGSVVKEIAVQARAADGMVEFEVKDCGCGISAEVAERLFVPFTTSKGSGMGLGLSICRSIVEAHGGRMWLAANGPDGASFRFTLPVGDKP